MKRLRTAIAGLLLGMLILVGVPSSAFAWEHPNKANAQEAYQKLLGLGYTPQAAAGLLGNAETESGFDPGRFEGGDSSWYESVKDSPCGSYNPGSRAIGFFQWDGGRASAMLCHWKNEGKKWDTIDSALQYIEVESSQANQFGDLGIDGFKKLTDVREATDYFMRNWERCGTCHEARRYEAAEGIYADFKDLKAIELGESASDEKATKEKATSGGGGAVLSEWELKGMPDEVKWNGDLKVEEKSAKDLSAGENYAISKLSDDLENGAKHWADKINVFVAFVGLLLMIWGMFLWMAALFDHVNNLVPIHLVRKLTFGKFEYTSEKEEAAEVKGMISAKGIVIRGFGAVIIGLLLLSGVMMGFLIEAVYYLDELTRTFMNKE